jgi:hypothetical protein
MSGTGSETPAKGGNDGNGNGSNPLAPQEGGKRSAWLTHVKKTMRANKGMKLKQVLKIAKKTYKKTMRGGSTRGGVATNAAQAGGRRRKNGTRKH